MCDTCCCSRRALESHVPPSAARAATQSEAIAHGENVTISVNIAQAFECVRVAVGCMAADQKAVAGAVMVFVMMTVLIMAINGGGYDDDDDDEDDDDDDNNDDDGDVNNT